MGARIDGVEAVQIIDLKIHDLVNESPLVSCACGSYEGPHDGGSPGQEEDEGGMGTDIRGIAISRGDAEIIGTKSKIAKLNSYYGDTTGLDLMDGTIIDFDIGSDITIKNLKSASKLSQAQYQSLVDQGKTPYPNNFDLCTINIEDASSVTGDIPEGKGESDCIDGRSGLVSGDAADISSVNLDDYKPPNFDFKHVGDGTGSSFNPESMINNKYNDKPVNQPNPVTEVVNIDETFFVLICGVILMSILLCNFYIMWNRCKGDKDVVRYAGVKSVGTDSEYE